MPERPDKLHDGLDSGRLEQLKWIMNEFSVDVLTALHWDLEAPWRLATRRVSDSMLLFPLSGSVRVTCEGRATIAKPGEFIMVRDDLEHAVDLPEGQRTLEMIAVHCYITNIWKVTLLSFFPEILGTLPDRHSFLTELRGFVSAFNNSDEIGQIWGGAILKRLLAYQVLHDAPLHRRTLDFDQRIGRALLRIHEFYHADISVEMLASDSLLSAAQFRKLFKNHMRVGPKEYLVQYRLKVAKRLLRETNRPLKRIAEDTGFQNVQYFHAVFRRYLKRTPTAFRRRMPSM